MSRLVLKAIIHVYEKATVLQLLANGRTMKEVAAALGITPRTVAFHKYNLMAGLGLERSADLIRFAIKHDIISA